MKKRLLLILLITFTLLLSSCENVYQVTYITNIETSDIIKEVDKGQTAPNVELRKEGYYLKGWFQNLDDCDKPNAAWDFENNLVTENITLHALWLPETYTITFNDMNGEPTWVYQMTYGTDIDVLQSITGDEVEGYTFIGWNETFPETMPANNLVFNPIYEIE